MFYCLILCKIDSILESYNLKISRTRNIFENYKDICSEYFNKYELAYVFQPNGCHFSYSINVAEKGQSDFHKFLQIY